MIKNNYFIENRKKIMKKTKRGFIFLSAYEKVQKTADMAGEFWQEANFYWLSGIDWPEWKILIDVENENTWLVEPNISDIQKSFEGYLSKEKASEISGVNNFLTIKEAMDKIKNQEVYSLKPQSKDEIWSRGNYMIKKHWKDVSGFAKNINDIREHSNPIRAIKTDYEINKIKEVIDITRKGFGEIDRRRDEISYESDIEAIFNYVFTKNQSTHAYSPIVASGKNACIMHYDKNASKIDGPVLMDIGARKDFFSADVTRMFYLTKPTKRQAEIHETLNDAQKNIIDLIKPGKSIRDYLDESDEIMKQAMIRLGIFKENSDFRKYYPHAIGHGLGIDVHEGLGGFDVFQPGMIMTVEPGIYIQDESVGFRVEDDILVTESGNDNLTKSIKNNT